MPSHSSRLALTSMLLLVSFTGYESVSETTKDNAVKRSRHFTENLVFNFTHILGPKQEYEPIREMSKEARLNRLTNLAKSHDTNADLLLEPEELKAWIRESMGIIHYVEAEQGWKEIDANEDGRLEFSEVLLRMQISDSEVKEMEGKAVKGQRLSKIDKGLVRIVKAERRRFDAADLNNDGVLNKEESLYFLQTFNYAFMATVELDIRMEEMDENNDNVISLKEFTSEGTDKEEVRELGLKFKGLDTDKNGQLSREELKVFVLPDNERGMNREVSKLMKEADGNKDGVLTLDEIVKGEDSFLTGMLTNYGLHLNYVKDEL